VNIVLDMAEAARDGFRPDDPYEAADILAALPGFFELMTENLGELATWLDDHNLGRHSDAVADIAQAVKTAEQAAGTATLEFQQGNYFWLSSRK
jgi:hypothetical protein